MSVVVSPVESRRDKREFVNLPFRLHATEPQWIPPLKLERHIFLNPRLNAYFRHAEVQLFLARRAGEVVGRISAQIDHTFNAHHGNRWGMFGFLEFEDDPQVLEALLAAAGDWLSARDRDRMVGPMDFALNDESGVIVSGGAREPLIRQSWHSPYVLERCEEAGLDKAMDLLMWELYVADRSKMLPIIGELAETARTEHGIRIRHMTRRSLRRDLDLFGEIYNEAWKRNWGFVPYTKEDLDAYAHDLHLVFDPAWFMVAERASDGMPVGVAITIPDINQVLQRMQGRLLPLGWLTYLRRRRIMDRLRVGFLGVLPEFQHAGVAALLYEAHFDMAAIHRISGGEMGWILETNTAMNRGMEAMGGRVVKRYRVFERRLEADAPPAWPADAKVWQPRRTDHSTEA